MHVRLEQGAARELIWVRLRHWLARMTGGFGLNIARTVRGKVQVFCPSLIRFSIILINSETNSRRVKIVDPLKRWRTKSYLIKYCIYEGHQNRVAKGFLKLFFKREDKQNHPSNASNFCRAETFGPLNSNWGSVEKGFRHIPIYSVDIQILVS